jgi:hypothetical protein
MFCNINAKINLCKVCLEFEYFVHVCMWVGKV